MTAQHLTPYENVLDTIGWTPLIRLSRIGAGLRRDLAHRGCERHVSG